MIAAGLILAAGASRRMGQPKALLQFEGETFLGRMVRIFASHCDPVVVVVAPGMESWAPQHNQALRVVVNPEPERGMLSSLQCGLAAIGDRAERILFTPMDLPGLHEGTVARMVAEAGAAEVVIPRCGEARGHPVAISRAVAEELLALDASVPGVQAKQVLRRDETRVRFIEIQDSGAVRDIDDPKDYQELLAANNVEKFS